MAGRTFRWSRVATLLLCISIGSAACVWDRAARGNIAPVAAGSAQGGTAMPVKESDVAVAHERLSITIVPTTAHSRATPIVEVRAEYRLVNTSDEPTLTSVAFPVAGEFGRSFSWYEPGRPPVEGLGFTVTLDDAPLPTTPEALPLPFLEGESGFGYAPQDRLRLREAWLRWVRADDARRDAILAFRRDTPTSNELSEAQSELETLCSAKLGSRDHIHYLASYLQGEPSRWDAIRVLLMDASPEFRKPTGGSDVPALSYVEPNDADLAMLSDRLNQWIDETPELRESASRMRDLRRRRDSATAALRDSIRQAMRSRQPDVDDATIEGVVQSAKWAYAERARVVRRDGAATLPNTAPIAVGPLDEPTGDGFFSESLLARLDPEIAAWVEAKRRQRDEVLGKYHFDDGFLSPLTGRSYRQRVGWRDDSTWGVLNYEPPKPSTRPSGIIYNDRLKQVAGVRDDARLLKFDVPLPARGEATLVVSYRALAELDNSSSFDMQGIVHVRYILQTAKYWKSFGPIDLTITLPDDGIAIVEPRPTTRAVRDGMQTLTARIDTAPAANLRIAWVPIVTFGQNRGFWARDLLDREGAEQSYSIRPDAVDEPAAREATARDLQKLIDLTAADDVERLRLLRTLLVINRSEPGSRLRPAFDLIDLGWLRTEAAMLAFSRDDVGFEPHRAIHLLDAVERLSREVSLTFENPGHFIFLSKLPLDPNNDDRRNDRMYLPRPSAEDRALMAARVAKLDPASLSEEDRFTRLVLMIAAPGRTPETIEAYRALYKASKSWKVRLGVMSMIANFEGFTQSDLRELSPVVWDEVRTMTTARPSTANYEDKAIDAFARGAYPSLEEALTLLESSQDTHLLLRAPTLLSRAVQEVDSDRLVRLADHALEAIAGTRDKVEFNAKYGIAPWASVLYEKNPEACVAAFARWGEQYPASRSVFEEALAEQQRRADVERRHRGATQPAR